MVEKGHGMIRLNGVRLREFWKIWGIGLLICLTACNTTRVLPTAPPPLPTYATLNYRAAYWDMGVSLQYPAGWVAFYGAGQLLIAPTADSTRKNPPTEPLVSLQFATLEQLKLDKTATLGEIAAKISSPTQASRLIDNGQVTFGGLDAAIITVEETESQLIQQAIAFRMPDGRIGWLIGLAPSQIWANFYPTMDKIRTSGQLLRSSEFGAQLPPEKVYFPEGDLTLAFPGGWKNQAVDKSGRLYHAFDATLYQDGSGFANGPQVIVSVFPRLIGQPLTEALRKTINGSPDAKIDPVTVGTQTGAQYITRDPASGQQVTFIAIEQPLKNTLIIFRWTVPAPLVEVARPILENLLRGVQFGNRVAG